MGRAGTASIEFGIMSPVLAALLFGMVDLSQAIIKQRLLNATVQQAGLMATQLSIQPDQTTTLTPALVNEASSVIYAIFPGLVNSAIYNSRSNPTPPFAVTLSEIVFNPTTTGCQAGLTCTSYTAKMLWSVSSQYGQPLIRACGTVPQVTPSASPSYVGGVPSTVPTANISSALTSTLAVDGMYQFTPTFAKFIGPITMHQSAYFNTRSIVSPSIGYSGAAAGSGNGGGNCSS